MWVRAQARLNGSPKSYFTAIGDVTPPITIKPFSDELPHHIFLLRVWAAMWIGSQAGLKGGA